MDKLAERVFRNQRARQIRRQQRLDQAAMKKRKLRSEGQAPEIPSLPDRPMEYKKRASKKE